MTNPTNPKHTPLPWNINKKNYCRIEVPKTNSDSTFEVATINNAANASLIVKSVNNYEPLLESLEQLIKFYKHTQGLDLPELETLIKKARDL
jgi:hypothetical protein